MISIAERKIHLLVYYHLNSLRKTSKYTKISKSSLSRWKKKVDYYQNIIVSKCRESMPFFNLL